VPGLSGLRLGAACLERSEVYFQFKPYSSKSSGEAVYLRDILELSCPVPIRERIESILIFPEGITEPVRITAIQVIGLIRQAENDISISHIGDSSVLYEPKKTNRENPVFVFLRVAFSLLLLFFGSALVIMYFHSDVNMNQAHEMIYYLISGEKGANPILFSVSYTVGIGAGIAIFFDVFRKIRKKDNPGPLELELHQAEKELTDYLKDREGKKGN
jgi:stage V sporulation protein AA